MKTHNRFQSEASKIDLISKSTFNTFQNRSQKNFEEESYRTDSSDGIIQGFSIPNNKDHGLNKINERKFSYLNIQSFTKIIKKNSLSTINQLSDYKRDKIPNKEIYPIIGSKKTLLDTIKKSEDKTNQPTNLKNKPSKRHRSIAHWVFTILGYTLVLSLALLGLVIVIWLSLGQGPRPLY